MGLLLPTPLYKTKTLKYFTVDHFNFVLLLTQSSNHISIHGQAAQDRDGLIH